MADSIVNVGILGFGFMGQTHYRAYTAANEAGHPCGVKAICDSAPERRTGLALQIGNIDTGQEAERLFDPATVTGYDNPAALLADDSIDLVSICTHTDSHIDLCIKALEAGKHVLIEKPVSTSSADVDRLAEVAASYPQQFIMPAMCIRFWPGYTWLKERTIDKQYGNIRSATFHRLGTRPGWAADFYTDLDRSGGALVDLHIHDVDFIYHLFGQPTSVASLGDQHHLTTCYRYAENDGPVHVVAEGGWDHAAGFAFQMRFVIIFDNATADFDSRRGPDALQLYENGEMKTIPLAEGAGYDFEIRHLIDLVAGRSKTQIATIAEAAEVTKILEAEHQSLRTAQVVEL